MFEHKKIFILANNFEETEYLSLIKINKIIYSTYCINDPPIRIWNLFRKNTSKYRGQKFINNKFSDC